MAQGHMDRLSSVDVSFLTNESSSSHMHVGAIMIFEGPPPDLRRSRSSTSAADCTSSRAFARSWPTRRPRPAGPFWIDDPTFNLEYHVRHSALPSPGSEDQLRRMAARVFSQQLDRTKPLWELWLVQGLTRKRFALITKTHHALVDGVSGVDIATVLFDLKPVPEPAEHGRRLGPPTRSPRSGTLLAKGVEDLLKAPVRAARRLEQAVAHPEAAARAGAPGARGGRRDRLGVRQPGARRCR